jgi:hypothetical protein
MRASAARLFELIVGGMLEVKIGQTFPLLEAADAQRAIEGRMMTGRRCSFREGGARPRAQEKLATDPEKQASAARTCPKARMAARRYFLRATIQAPNPP